MIASLRLTRAHDLEVDDTLRRVVVTFRVLAWLWMVTLVVITLATDDGARPVVVVVAIAIATVWTGVTVWAARVGFLGTAFFVVVDGVVSLGLGVATTVAEAEDFFHGGMPMSWILVAAYAYGFWGALPASIPLGIEQVIVHFVDGKSAVSAAGSLVFIVFAAILGMAFDALRNVESRRIEAQAQLAEERSERIRHEERANIADQLHDSVLQSLYVIRRDAEDAQQVRYLARRQERALRRKIDEYRSPYANSFRAALLAACDHVEDTYRIEVDAVFRDDAESNDQLEAVVGAAREALANAAKHSGEDHVDLYAEASTSLVTVHIRDRGRGFDAQSSKTDGGMVHSLVQRITDAGGTVAIESRPGARTEVTISMALEE